MGERSKAAILGASLGMQFVGSDDCIAVGDLALDPRKMRVKRGSREIVLRPAEYRLLAFLLGEPGRAFSRAELLVDVWGPRAPEDERTVDVHIGRLRKALSRGHERDPIRTVRGAGYSFDRTAGGI